MTLGELRQEIEKFSGLTDETRIKAMVEDESGEFVDQDVFPGLHTLMHDGETFLYIETRVQS
jgi:hypothetical protein